MGRILRPVRVRPQHSTAVVVFAAVEKGLADE